MIQVIWIDSLPSPFNIPNPNQRPLAAPNAGLNTSRQVVSPAPCICSYLINLRAADLCGIVDKRGHPVKFQLYSTGLDVKSHRSLNEGGCS